MSLTDRQMLSSFVQAQVTALRYEAHILTVLAHEFRNFTGGQEGENLMDVFALRTPHRSVLKVVTLGVTRAKERMIDRESRMAMYVL